MRGPFGDFGNKVFLTIIVLMIAIVWSTALMQMKKRKEERKKLSNMDENLKKVILKTQGKKVELDKQKALKLIKELTKEGVSPHHSSFLEPKIYIEVISKSGSKKWYSIAPDSDVRGEFWLYLEKEEAHYADATINQVHSDWILNFLKEKGLYNYSFDDE